MWRLERINKKLLGDLINEIARETRSRNQDNHRNFISKKCKKRGQRKWINIKKN